MITIISSLSGRPFSFSFPFSPLAWGRVGLDLINFDLDSVEVGVIRDVKLDEGVA